MKNIWRVVFFSILIISSIVVPILINESYKYTLANKEFVGYLTLWNPSDLLLYYGNVLSALGAAVIGFIAFKQNDRSNDISDRLLKLQEINSVPHVHIDINASKIHSISLSDVDILIGFRNETNSVINIVDISNLKLDLRGNSEIDINFCNGWTKYYSILPHKTIGINFLAENVTSEQIEKLILNTQFVKGLNQIVCGVNLKLQYATSKDTYDQKMEFYIITRESNNKHTIENIFNVENEITKVE